jgi:BRCT domain type II-containing protein
MFCISHSCKNCFFWSQYSAIVKGVPRSLDLIPCDLAFVPNIDGSKDTFKAAASDQ